MRWGYSSSLGRGIVCYDPCFKIPEPVPGRIGGGGNDGNVCGAVFGCDGVWICHAVASIARYGVCVWPLCVYSHLVGVGGGGCGGGGWVFHGGPAGVGPRGIVLAGLGPGFVCLDVHGPGGRVEEGD
jgi:hypothetical protein